MAGQWGQCTDPAEEYCDEFIPTTFVDVWTLDPYRNIHKTITPSGGDQYIDGLSVKLAQGEYRDALFMLGPLWTRWRSRYPWRLRATV